MWRQGQVRIEALKGASSILLNMKKCRRELKQKWAKGCCLNFDPSKGALVVLELICIFNILFTCN